MILDDQNAKALRYKDLTIQGYSRAAVQTYWRIPEMKLGFDLGAQPWSFMGTPTWFISHTHMDHILALPAYVARRRMMKMEPPKIYLPTKGVEPIRHILRNYSRLDRGRLPCDLIGVEPGDEIELSRELVVKVYATKHTIPSLGYIIWERRNKLKPEFVGLTGEKLRDLKLAGEEITAEIRIPRVAYLGDSCAEGLDNNPEMFEAEVLIMELTFLAKSHREAAIDKFGHIFLGDIVERKDRFKNGLVAAGHFSTRYHPNQIRRLVRRELPDMLDGRLKLWIDGEPGLGRASDEDDNTSG